MAVVTIKNLSDETYRAIKLRAKKHHHVAHNLSANWLF